MLRQKVLRLAVFFLCGVSMVVPLGGCPRSSAPTVSFTSPAGGATNVATARKISATFSEIMDAATINTTTFIVMQGSTPVAGTVVYQGVTAVFDPASDLAPNTVYTATITTGARSLAHHDRTLAQDFVWTFTTGGALDTTAPTVNSAAPSDGATDLPLGRNLIVTFSEPMDPSTVTTSTFTLHQGANSISGTVSYSGVTAIFNPATLLDADTEYTATISTDASDLAGNPLEAAFVWSFSTGGDIDTTAPSVTSTDPAFGALEVSVNKRILVTFSEPMDPLTITTAEFTLFEGQTAVIGTVSYSGVTATFTPAGGLAANTVYTAAISLDAADVAGNKLPGNFVWTFTTGESTDVTPPEVSFTNPEFGSLGVALNNAILVAFSEAMDPASVNSATFTVFQGATPVAGFVAYSGVTATFTPSGGLAANMIYTVAVSLNATDLAGNNLPGNYVWTFTTGGAGDTTAPGVNFTDPVNGALDVAINEKIAITFSEAMDPLTITPAEFTLFHGATPVAGTVTYSGRTATFSPIGGLATNTLYTAAVSLNATDLAGNMLPGNYVWTFTTGGSTDATPPGVSFTDPANADLNVSANKKIIVTFTEAMDPLTITSAEFTLFHGATPVAGAVTCSGKTAIFSPIGGLAPNTDYTAAVSMDATDLSGNPLPGNFVWTFTTSGTTDLIAPEVSATVPVDGTAGLPTNLAIDITFSETMDPLTINTTTIILENALGPVSGKVTYSGMVATFIPDADLGENTTYIATVLTGATDLAGNALSGDFELIFATGGSK